MDYTESNNMQSASKIRRAAYASQLVKHVGWTAHDISDKAFIKAKDGAKSKTDLYYIMYYKKDYWLSHVTKKFATLELSSHRRTELSEDTECEIVNGFTMDNKLVNLSSQTVW